jgi:hypothetical protein
MRIYKEKIIGPIALEKLGYKENQDFKFNLIKY